MAVFTFFLVSVLFVSILIFMLVAGSISELVGRKKTLILGQVFMIIGWVVIYLAQNFLTLLIGRFIIGIGIGIGLPVTTLQLRSGDHCASEVQLMKVIFRINKKFPKSLYTKSCQTKPR